LHTPAYKFGNIFVEKFLPVKLHLNKGNYNFLLHRVSSELSVVALIDTLK
jgi:hypothetical protein